MPDLAARFLAHHLEFHPVDATFMGLPGHDARLPPADVDAPAREDAAIGALLRQLEAAPEGGRDVDGRLVGTALRQARRDLVERPRYRDPTWYTGEAVFGLISLLLPNTLDPDPAHLSARLAAIPGFLADGTAHLMGGAAFSGWVTRARTEVAAGRRLLGGLLQQHGMWRDGMAGDAARATDALGRFDQVLAALPDADPRCGRDYLDFAFRDVHALPFGSAEALGRAEARIPELHAELAALATRIDHARSWQEQLADLHRIQPDPERLPDTYRALHEQTMQAASALLTPATGYDLTFKPFPAWSRPIHGDLYFLAYRCPPGAQAGTGSVYWTAPPGQSTATIKSTHIVHHGSIGHHTQNARARAAPSVLARIANQGVARGIALQSGLTMGEGWSCYVQTLMEEVDGFYSPAEILWSRWHELRNAACLVADIRFHTRDWDLAAMRRYYRDVAGFPAGRVDFETVKNAIFPANRAMYWIGVEQIRAARRAWRGPVRAFHDGLIARGHVPLAWAIDDLAAAPA